MYIIDRIEVMNLVLSNVLALLVVECNLTLYIIFPPCDEAYFQVISKGQERI